MEPRLKASGHSSLEMVFPGTVEFQTDMACYATVWNGREGMERMYVWFPKHTCKLIAEYVNWVLNSDLFGEAFITKDFETGMVDGFEVNIHMPTNFLFSAMAALRFPWETDISSYSSNSWTYAKFSELGFTPKQCLFILTSAYYEDGNICPSQFNTNHLPIPRHLDWPRWKPESFKRQKGTMYEQSQSEGVTACWGVERYSSVRCFDKYVKFTEDKWGCPAPTKLTDEIIEKLKEALKED